LKNDQRILSLNPLGICFSKLFGCGSPGSMGLKRRVRQYDASCSSLVKRIQVQKQHADSRCALHVAGLSNEQFWPHAMLGLNPFDALALASRAHQQIRRHLLGEFKILAFTRDTIQAQEKFRDGGGAAALAHIVPKSTAKKVRYRRCH
jgi:hypothetical protein